MHPETVIGAIVIGLIIGVLARLVVPGRQHMPIWMTLLVGLVGTFAGMFIGAAINAGNVVTFLLEVVVAAALVYLIAGRSRVSR